MKGKEEIKVDKISVKMANTGYRSDSVSKSDSSVKPVTEKIPQTAQRMRQRKNLYRRRPHRQKGFLLPTR